jgi:hypothetical protein
MQRLLLATQQADIRLQFQVGHASVLPGGRVRIEGKEPNQPGVCRWCKVSSHFSPRIKSEGGVCLLSRCQVPSSQLPPDMSLPAVASMPIACLKCLAEPCIRKL